MPNFPKFWTNFVPAFQQCLVDNNFRIDIVFMTHLISENINFMLRLKIKTAKIMSFFFLFSPQNFLSIFLNFELNNILCQLTD